MKNQKQAPGLPACLQSGAEANWDGAPDYLAHRAPESLAVQASATGQPDQATEHRIDEASFYQRPARRVHERRRFGEKERGVMKIVARV